MTDAVQPSDIVGAARNYDELIACLRAWKDKLDVSHETLDQLSGLPDRYTQKLIGRVPVKSIGKTSLGCLLSCLGLQLIVAVDHETLAKYADRRTPRKVIHRYANGCMLTSRRSVNKALPAEMARMMGLRAALLMSKPQRTRRARLAAKVRWAKEP